MPLEKDLQNWDEEGWLLRGKRTGQGEKSPGFQVQLCLYTLPYASPLLSLETETIQLWTWGLSISYKPYHNPQPYDACIRFFITDKEPAAQRC